MAWVARSMRCPTTRTRRRPTTRYANSVATTPGFFATMGGRVIAGRDFSATRSRGLAAGSARQRNLCTQRVAGAERDRPACAPQAKFAGRELAHRRRRGGRHHARRRAIRRQSRDAHRVCAAAAGTGPLLHAGAAHRGRPARAGVRDPRGRHATRSGSRRVLAADYPGGARYQFRRLAHHRWHCSSYSASSPSCWLRPESTECWRIRSRRARARSRSAAHSARRTAVLSARWRAARDGSSALGLLIGIALAPFMAVLLGQAIGGRELA